MAPIQFEEDIKNKLEKRTIQSSKQAWGNLSERLGTEEKKSNKKGIWWLSLAASIASILLVSKFFLISENKNIETIIVEEHAVKDTLNKTKTLKVTKGIQQPIIVKNTDRKINNKIEKINKKEVMIPNNTIKKNNVPNLKNSIQKVFVVAQNTSTTAANNSIKNHTNTAPKTSKNSVLDQEIDILIANASKNIAQQKNKQSTIPIDHNGLLIEVEDDLDETFRDKMLKAVKQGYKTVRESVAERNN